MLRSNPGSAFENGTMMKPLSSTRPLTPLNLPPKSPASVPAGKKLFASSTRSSSRRSSRRRGRSKEKSRMSDASSTSDSTSHAEPALQDPSPHHLNVTESGDDFANTADFSMVSFDKNKSPSSVLDPFHSFDYRQGKGKDKEKRAHRRSHSWDSGDAVSESASKTCVPVPAIFRRQKVMCSDVASVSNASDTLVSLAEKGRITGRELHEAAKEVLNEGDYESAVFMFETLLNAQLDRFGKEHSSVGAAMHNVGVVRMRMGQLDSAEESLVQAVSIRRKVLGNDHLDLASTLTKLGTCQLARRQFSSALASFREAKRITRTICGRCHKTVAEILCHIANLYFEAGEFFSAQATFEDALDIYRDVFNTEVDRDGCMAQITETLCNIGSIKNKRKDFQGAIHCFREALDLQRGLMGHDHPRVIATLDNLGYSFSKNKSYNQALTCYKEMLTAQTSKDNEFTMQCCETLKKQIIIYQKLDNLQGAIAVTKKAHHGVKTGKFEAKGPVLKEIEKSLLKLVRKRDKCKGCF